MARGPITSAVTCPTCAGTTYAVIPNECAPVGIGEPESDDYDGKVWTTCNECDERFIVFYETEE